MILLLEAAHRLLPPTSAALSRKAAAVLERLGVQVRTETMVTGIGSARRRGAQLADRSEVIAVSTVPGRRAFERRRSVVPWPSVPGRRSIGVAG